MPPPRRFPPQRAADDERTRPRNGWVFLRLAWLTLVQAIVPALAITAWATLPPAVYAYAYDSPRKRPKQAAQARALLEALNAA